MMGLITWIQRKIELSRVKNEAHAEALKDYYKSNDYKNDIKKQEQQKQKDGKSNGTGSWLKRVSQNAARNLNNETVRFDKDKLFGKKK